MKLVCLNTELAGREFVVTGNRFTIGRAPDCDVVFDQGSVSRNHAMISLEKGRYILRDIKSLNGVSVEGKKVDEAPIGPGQVFAVGDVQVQLVFDPPPMPEPTHAVGAAAPPAGPDPAPASPSLPTATGSAPPGPAPVNSLFQAAAPVAPSPAAELPARAREGLGASGYTIAALLVIVLAGLYLFYPRGNEAGPKPYSFAVKMKRNEQRALYMPKLYDPETVEVSEEDVLKVNPLSERILVLEAKGAGSVVVAMRRLNRRPMQVNVIVRGVIQDEMEELRFRQLSDDQRLTEAESCVVRAANLRRTQLYEAIRLYRKAEVLLKPLMTKPLIYHETRRHLKAAERELEEAWKDLRFQYTQLVRTADLVGARTKLMLMHQLIPDEADWRRQVVGLYLQELDKEIERQSRKQKK